MRLKLNDHEDFASPRMITAEQLCQLLAAACEIKCGNLWLYIFRLPASTTTDTITLNLTSGKNLWCSI